MEEMKVQLQQKWKYDLKEIPRSGAGLGLIKGEQIFKLPFYHIGNFVSYMIKTLREDAHSREEGICRKRPRSARECALAHSLFKVTQDNLSYTSWNFKA
ncbi:MAG: hypothetical protein HFG41_05670 [Coprococcus sp.]|nr:hypothetical protein [Coprococcus sp.]